MALTEITDSPSCILWSHLNDEDVPEDFDWIRFARYAEQVFQMLAQNGLTLTTLVVADHETHLRHPYSEDS